MLHTEIENEEIVERYVRNRLGPEERQAFEEHFFACEECFEKVQTAERFLAGIADAADHGLLNAPPRAELAFGHRLNWVLAAATCAASVLAAVVGWTYFNQVPKLRAELDRTTAQLRAEQQSLAASAQRAAPVEQAEANVPLVMLQASRADEEPASTLMRPGSERLVLWIEMGSSRYRQFRLEIFSQDNRLVASVDHLERGPYGALAASVPADRLPTGEFRIKLSGQDPLPASLAGEYRLRVRRP
jgi:hypothetical protein